jgi:hypothetical protein
MSFTDKENSKIKDRLMEVETPSVDRAWSLMSDKLGPVPIQKGFFQQLLEKYALYLNVFVGAILLTSGVLLHSKVQRNKPSQIQQILTPSSSTIFTAEFPIAGMNQRNNTLPIAELNNRIENIESKAILEKVEIVDELPSPSISEDLDDNIQLISTDEQELLEEESSPLLGESDKEFDEPIWEVSETFSKSYWGISAGLQIMPDVAFQNLLRTGSAGLFIREYLTPQKAFQVDVLYNPIAIRPFGYIEKSINRGVVLTDSAQVQVLRYASFAISRHHSFREIFSLMYGVQYSRLIDMKGELTQISSAIPGSETNTTEYTKIKNLDAFAKNDLAIVAEFNFNFSRFSAGIRLQQSLVDQSKAKLGPNVHRYSTLQVKTSMILNR